MLQCQELLTLRWHLVDSLNHAIITPLLNKPSLHPQDMASYRSVSDLSLLSKLIERIVLIHLSSHVMDFNLLSPSQSAYWTSYSTETTLLAIQNYLLVATDAGYALKFRPFIISCTQLVRALGVTSLPVALLFGVPQVSVLGPSLFTSTAVRSLLLFMRLGSSSSPTAPKSTSTSSLLPIIRLWL